MKGKKIEENIIVLPSLIISLLLFISCRKIQQLRKKVRNRARVEGCIVEAELVEEAILILFGGRMPV